MQFLEDISLDNLLKILVKYIRESHEEFESQLGRNFSCGFFLPV